MKDETCGVPIKCFVGLKSKMYAFIRLNHIKNNFFEYRPFFLIFALISAAILFSLPPPPPPPPPPCYKNVLIFFVQQYTIEDCMNRILYEYKEKLQKRSHVYYRNLSEDEKIKKNMLQMLSDTD